MGKKLLQTALAQSERLAANIALGVLVDPQDLDLLEKHLWHLGPDGYLQTEHDGQTVWLKNLVWARMQATKPAKKSKKQRKN